MATTNPFDLLGGDDNDDPMHLLANVQLQKAAAAASAPAAGKKASAPAGGGSAKLPSKPAPPAQAVRDSRTDGGRGGGRGTGRVGGRGRGGGGYYRDSANSTFSSDNGFAGGDVESGRPSERRPYSGPRGGGGFRGGRRGGFSNGEAGEGERPRRVFDRRSGTGRADVKRDGAGRGNWGTASDEFAPVTEEAVGEKEANAAPVEKPSNEVQNVDANKETPATEPEEKEPEELQMTLEEYEKVLEEKRKALQPTRAEERKVDVKEFASMQLISKKKDDDEVFIKVGSEKDKRREAAEKEERAKKSVSINEFLKPAEGEGYYRPGGRGRGRGRGSWGGGFGGGNSYSSAIPKIEDPGQFPSLGAK